MRDAALVVVPVVLVMAALFVTLNFLAQLPMICQGFNPFGRHEGKRPRYAFRSSSCAKFRGSQQVGLISVSGPFSLLTMDSQWASIEGPVADIWVDRSNTVLVRRITHIFSDGVFFETGDHSCDGLIFWSTNALVWRALADFGWPCEASTEEVVGS